MGSVILISGVGLLLLTMTIRFGRIVNRTREISHALSNSARNRPPIPNAPGRNCRSSSPGPTSSAPRFRPRRSVCWLLGYQTAVESDGGAVRSCMSGCFVGWVDISGASLSGMESSDCIFDHSAKLPAASSEPECRPEEAHL